MKNGTSLAELVRPALSFCAWPGTSVAMSAAAARSACKRAFQNCGIPLLPRYARGGGPPLEPQASTVDAGRACGITAQISHGGAARAAEQDRWIQRASTMATAA